MVGWISVAVSGGTGALVGVLSSRLAARTVLRDGMTGWWSTAEVFSSRSRAVRRFRSALVVCLTGICFAAIVGSDAVAESAPGASRGILLASHLFLAAVTVVLAVIDIETHRLPHAIVLPSIVVALATVVLADSANHSGTSLRDALVGLCVSAGFFGVVRLLSPRALGGGDVTLAALLGLYLGVAGGPALFLGVVAATCFGGLQAVLVVVGGYGSRHTAIPFGPWMIVGTWAAILLSPRE